MLITGLLPTHHLPEESMPWMAEARKVFGELVVFIDENRATAGTESRAKSVGTRVHHFKAKTWYDSDWGAMARACDSDWVFFIDYDEQLSPEWQQDSWRQILETTDFTHFWCPRRWVVPGGRYISAGPWWPDPQLRLLRNGVAGSTFPTELHDQFCIPGSGGHFQHLALHHHNLWMWSRAAREDKVQFYERLRPGRGLGHYYQYEDYACPIVTLPEATAWDADQEVLRMGAPCDALVPDEIARISLEVGAVPSAVNASETFWIDAIVRNATSRPLPALPPCPVRLGYHWIQGATRQMVVFDGHRTELFPCVRANDSNHYWMRVESPNVPGNYILQTTVVQDGVSWFEHVRPDILQEFEVVVC
jgi:hypothetical protein